MKCCNRCNSSENLRRRVVKGKLQILSICNNCFGKAIFNLIRINDEEFKNNRNIIEHKIYEKLKSYTNNNIV